MRRILFEQQDATVILANVSEQSRWRQRWEKPRLDDVLQDS